MSTSNGANTNNVNSDTVAQFLTFGNKMISFGNTLVRIGNLHQNIYTQTGDVVVINDAASFTQSGTEVTIH